MDSLEHYLQYSSQGRQVCNSNQNYFQKLTHLAIEAHESDFKNASTTLTEVSSVVFMTQDFVPAGITKVSA